MMADRKVDLEAAVRVAIGREFSALIRERMSIQANCKVDLLSSPERCLPKLQVLGNWKLYGRLESGRGNFNLSDLRMIEDAAIAYMQMLRVPPDEIEEVLKNLFEREG
jgi:hypothetical protein